MAVPFAMAALSWRYVEQPIRRGQRSATRRRMMAALAPTVFSDNQTLAAGRPVAGPDLGCAICDRAASAPTFAVRGDSHAAAMAPGIDAAANPAGRRSGCPPLIDYDNTSARAAQRTACREHNAAALRIMQDRCVPLVLARATLHGIDAHADPSRAALDARQRLTRHLLQSFAARHGSLVIDPLPALCDEEICRVEHGGVSHYMDTDHLTLRAARALAPLFVPVFERGRIRSGRLARP